MPKYTMKKIKDKSQTGRWYLESVYQITLIKNSFKILRKGKYFNEKEIDKVGANTRGQENYQIILLFLVDVSLV